MQCADCRTRLDAYLDDELTTDERAEVREHLAGCTDCARELAALERASTLAQEHLVHYEAPDVLKARIASAIASERSAPASASPARPRRPSWWRLAVAGVIIALASSGLTFAVVHRGSGPPALADQVLASHIRSLMPGHLTDVQSTNEHNVKPWFNGRVDFSPKVPTLDSAGFPLVGGRLDYLDGRMIAAVVYARRQHLINVDSWPEAGPNEEPASTDAHGYHLIHWRTDNVEYWAVSDLESRDLSNFVSLYRR